MCKIEQLKMMLASYYRFWGAEMAELLDIYDETEQRRIVYLFMDIIRMGRWKEENEMAVITCGIPAEIKSIMNVLMNLYLLDMKASKCVEDVKEMLVK